MVTDTPRRELLLVLAATVALALLFRLWPTLDLIVAREFFGPEGFAPAKQGLNGVFYRLGDAGGKLVYVSLSFAAIGALLGMPRLRAWRTRLAFLWLAVALGPGLLVHLVLKEEVDRPRPYQVVEFGGPQPFVPAFAAAPPEAHGSSFVSGHASIAVYLMALAWVYPQRRRHWLLAAIGLGLAMGLTRMSAGAHFLSDIVFAFVAVYLTTAFAAWTIGRLLPPDAGQSRADS